ncbi:hypothetical protein [Pseudoxanthomonas sp. LARHCG66]
MRNFGLYGFITMVIVAAACVMLAAESHPAMIVLLLGGFGLLAFRFNAIIDRGRTRRGKAPDFTMQFANLTALTARDWTELVVTVLVSVAMCAIGIVVFGGQVR